MAETNERRLIEMKFNVICPQVCSNDKWCTNCKIYDLYQKDLKNLKEQKDYKG